MIHKLPQEIATWYIIPTVRREFVKELIRQGLSQKKAAQKLGLTEAAVSNYMKDKRATEIKLNQHILDLIKGSVVNILSKQSDVFTEVYNVVKECEKDVTICEIHAAYDEIPDGCNICFEKKGSDTPHLQGKSVPDYNENELIKIKNSVKEIKTRI